MVRNKEIWIPTYETLQLRPCSQPPPKEIILEEVARACEELGLPYPIIGKRQLPDKNWAQSLLSTLKPDHEMFQKGFQYKIYKAARDPTRNINNEDGFFSNLKLSKRKPAKGKKTDIFVNAKAKKQNNVKANPQAQYVVEAPPL